MGVGRNAVLAVFATGVLLAGLLVLIPDTAKAVVVRPSGVGSVANDGAFMVDVIVDVPTGEHIPLTFAEVRLAPRGSFSGGLVPGTTCLAQTGSSPSATITAIIGGEGVVAPFSGYGYDIVATGYGYDLGTSAAVNFGGASGYGYGYGTPNAADTLTVRIRVAGCSLPYAGHVFDGILQASVGGDATTLFRSTPVNVHFVDPTFTTATTTTTGTVVLTGAVTESGNVMLFNLDLGIAANLGADAGATFDLGTLLGTQHAGGALTINPEATLPAGTTFAISFLDIVGDPTIADDTDLLFAPPFGISGTALRGQTSRAPAVFFTLELNVPGTADADENALLEFIDISLDVPRTYVGADPGLMRVFGFDSQTGALDGVFMPRSIDCSLDSSTTCRYGFRITQFSSFAMSIGAALGGGGRGSSNVGATTTAATIPTSSGTTPTGTSDLPTTGHADPNGEELGPASEGGKKNRGIPGAGLGLLLASLAALAVIARRRL